MDAGSYVYGQLIFKKKYQKMVFLTNMLEQLDILWKYMNHDLTWNQSQNISTFIMDLNANTQVQNFWKEIQKSLWPWDGQRSLIGYKKF